MERGKRKRKRVKELDSEICPGCEDHFLDIPLPLFFSFESRRECRCWERVGLCDFPASQAPGGDSACAGPLATVRQPGADSVGRRTWSLARAHLVSRELVCTVRLVSVP